MRGSFAISLLAVGSLFLGALASDDKRERIKILVRPKAIGGVPDNVEGEGYIEMTWEGEPVTYDFGGVYSLSYAEIVEGSSAIVCIVETKSGPNSLPAPVVPSSVGSVKRLRARSEFLVDNMFTKRLKFDKPDDPVTDAVAITCKRRMTFKSKRDIAVAEDAVGSITVADKINENEVRVTVWPKVDGEHDHKVMLSQGSGTLTFDNPDIVTKAAVTFGLPGVQCTLLGAPYFDDYSFSAADPLDLTLNEPNEMSPSGIKCELPQQQALPANGLGR